jgi:Dullard-like phosphatase family protein
MIKQYLTKEKTIDINHFSSNSYSSIDISHKTESKSLLFHNSVEAPISSTKSYIKNILHYEKFLIQVSKLNFCPISCTENISGNYDNYIKSTLSHIVRMKDIKFNYALESPLIYDKFPKVEIEKISLSNKKLLLLDLDETLIHSDFSEQFLDNENIKYDGIISFLLDNSITDDESKDDSDEKKLNSVGIFIRPGVQKFLDEVSKYFEVGIFTASIPEYADAAINYLDPENKYIKLRLYRNNCINVGNLFKVKDLRILKNINIKNIVLVDNNMYSFIPQLNNGILINSFYYDKEDKELDNVLRYLIDYIFPADDVRKINGQFFGFKTILDDISKNLI